MTAKASSIYVFMIVAFGVGLWVILSYGSLLEAPENLAGKWDLIPATSPPIETDLTGPMVIEQSGQFVNLRFGSGRRIQVKLIDTTDAPHGQPARTVQLRNSDWHMTVAGLRGSDERQIVLMGPEKHIWMALRSSPGAEVNAEEPSESDRNPNDLPPLPTTHEILGPTTNAVEAEQQQSVQADPDDAQR